MNFKTKRSVDLAGSIVAICLGAIGLISGIVMISLIFAILADGLIMYGLIMLMEIVLFVLTIVYGAITCKGKVDYLYSEEEKIEYALNNPGKIEYQRYKGLGEMSKEPLWDTTMNPETRTLIRVTMKDAAEADQMFAMLMGENPSLRRQFIEENASLVTDLDV